MEVSKTDVLKTECKLRGRVLPSEALKMYYEISDTYKLHINSKHTPMAPWNALHEMVREFGQLYDINCQYCKHHSLELVQDASDGYVHLKHICEKPTFTLNGTPADEVEPVELEKDPDGSVGIGMCIVLDLEYESDETGYDGFQLF